MYAILKTGGKQYCVNTGDEIKVEKLPGDVGETVTFDKILLVSDGEEVKIGKPYLEDSKVMGKIVRQGKNRKIVILKYKKRKNYQRKNGHRQLYTLVSIGNIE